MRYLLLLFILGPFSQVFAVAGSDTWSAFIPAEPSSESDLDKPTQRNR